MDHIRLENAKNGYTVDGDGNRFNFSNPGIPGVHIYDNVWPDSMEFFNSLLTKDFWDLHDFLIMLSIQEKMVNKQILAGFIHIQKQINTFGQFLNHIVFIGI